ncbi:uncharacterized protein LOC135165921 [Diachasmimorpha longicaudata]|uniref:uncharacterized protein LOC135165921 n=1 Tax=Diachasmimorpha longicaudata TaxID=58733 RepID=UPI0030B8F5C2
MAQYYNLIADTGVPIVTDDGQQYCTVDGNVQFVVQNLNNCVYGSTRIVTYTPAVQNSEHIFTPAGEQLQGQSDQRQSVYIINTEDRISLPPPLKPTTTPETSNFLITDTKNPNDPQVQWVTFSDPSKMSPKPTPPPKPPQTPQSTPRRTPKPKQILPQPLVPRSKILPPKPSPRSPIHPDPQKLVKTLTPVLAQSKTSSQVIKTPPPLVKTASPLVRPTGSLPKSSGLLVKPSAPLTKVSLPTPKNPPLQPLNRGAQTLGSYADMGFLSERIKHARNSHGKTAQNTPVQVKPILTPQKSPTPPRPPQKQIEPPPESMEIDTSTRDPQNSSDGDAGSESIAYLQQTITNPNQAIVQEQIKGNTVKMLVVLPTGEQRLITFDIPNEECTVQDLLEQANIPQNGETTVSLVKDPILHINYIVESGEGGVISMVVDSPDCPDEGMSETISPEGTINPDESNASEDRKFVENQLAVCPHCGCCSMDFIKCARCKTKLPDNPKTVPLIENQKKEALIPVDNFYSRKKADTFNKDVKKPKGRLTRPVNSRTKTLIKEPECLTLSSDDEDENPAKKCKKGDSMKLSQVINRTHSDELATISDKEPIITSMSKSSDPSLDDSTISDNMTSVISTSLSCRTVRIGSYKYVPHDNIIINSSGLILSVPLLEDDKKTVAIHVMMSSIVKVLIHFGKAMPVLFFYTSVKSGEQIRGVLGMQDPIGPYYDPAGKDHTHKRITLLPEKISEESKNILKQLFSQNNLCEELNSKEANDILVKASPKDNVHNPRRASTTSGTNGVVEKITVYPPPPAKGGIALNTEDYACLGEDQFLNDAIIDFYLKYLTLERLSEEDASRTHVFSSYFYKRLTSPTQSGDSVNVSPAVKRHTRVQKWTKNVNIFEKDFVVIPINEHAHWFLAIICFPGLVGVVSPPREPVKGEKVKKKVVESSGKGEKSKLQTMTIGTTTITPATTVTKEATTITLDPADDLSERDEAEGDEEELMETSDEEGRDEEDEDKREERLKVKVAVKEEVKEEIKEEIEEYEDIQKIPCILIFDSLAGPGRARVVATLRDYLSCEYQAKMGKEKIFSRDTIKGACPKVPQQSNFTDCGLYVLQYVESFFESPIKNYQLPIKTLKNWFEEIIVTRKREEISKLVVKLMLAGKGDKSIVLPVVQFPTVEGKLRPRTEAEKKEERKVKEEEKDEDKKTTTTTYVLVPAGGVVNSDGNVELTISAVDKSKLSGGPQMSFLRTKRIPRLLRESPTQMSEISAKKHKGDNDSCK